MPIAAKKVRGSKRQTIRQDTLTGFIDDATIEGDIFVYYAKSGVRGKIVWGRVGPYQSAQDAKAEAYAICFQWGHNPSSYLAGVWDSRSGPRRGNLEPLVAYRWGHCCPHPPTGKDYEWKGMMIR